MYLIALISFFRFFFGNECLRSDFGHNLRIEIYFLKSIKNYKSDISHFASVSCCGSPVVSPRCNTPLWLQPWLPLVASSSRRLKRARARWWNDRKDTAPFTSAPCWGAMAVQMQNHNGVLQRADTTGEPQQETDAKWEMSLLYFVN